MNRQKHAFRDAALGVVLLIALVAVTVWLMRMQRADRDDAGQPLPATQRHESQTP